MILDNLEYINVQKQVTDFPKHYHETFCISLIHKGIEQIELENQSIFSEKGCITITNPYEIHANPLIDNTSQVEFDTIYISKDVMKYLFNGKNITFVNRKINNKNANQLFRQLKNAIIINDIPTIENLLFQFVATLKHYSQEKKEEYSELNFNSLHNISSYIDNNISSKFCLDELSKVANLNKYGFAKKFKASTGMTPMNYILMKKIFSSKKLITKTTDLTQIAFDYEFSDLAHFSNTFKRYVGISPKIYQKSISSIL
ncbi:AraC family transcriptional regulator [Aquimarina macrocephali]|uniref:AraC family transcriptional regulator n=1 Tax=Aquimarina macrocephali TaxID=666563 RepID=UPI0004659011|nr:AraC family transcriptional regulator [Aquimarina macrocephali]